MPLGADREVFMRKSLAAVLFVVAAAAYTGCYVTQDPQGQWWACEDYPAATGVASACTPIQPPF